MESAELNTIVNAVADWAIARDDIRAMALVGSWARGNPHEGSDVDLLLLSDRADAYQHFPHWLTEIDFTKSGYQPQSSESATYGAVWSQHIRLLPDVEVEVSFAKCSWAQTEPIDSGTRGVVKDAFRIILDKDGLLTRLVYAVMSGQGHDRQNSW
jgi:hypothetical protein